VRNEMNASIKDFGYPSSGLSLPKIWQEPGQTSTTEERAQAFRLSKLGGSNNEEDEPCSSSADRIDEDHSNRFEEGRVQGYSEGRSAERAELASRMQQLEAERMDQAARLTEQFERDRERYGQSIEFDVAKLALSIASRILRREMQIDPLLLTGAVRVALGQITDKVSVRMRVPAEHAHLWSETMEHLPSFRVKPAIVADKQLQPGECFLETEMGSADVGLRTQFCAIARTLFDEPGAVSEQIPTMREHDSAVQE
jgi:flagellar assembly protein FliH